MKRKHSTAAQVRDAIDRGRARDKAPGLDLAAAPMETDAEAGGTPPSPIELNREHSHVTRHAEGRRPNAVEPDLTPDGALGREARRPPGGSALLLLLSIVLVAMAIYLLLS